MKLGRLFAKVHAGSFTALDSCRPVPIIASWWWPRWPGLAGPVQCEGCSPQLLLAKLQSPCPHQARGGRLQPPAVLAQPSHGKNGGNCSTEQTLSVNRQAFKNHLDIFFLIYQRTDHTLRRWWRFAVSAEEDGLNPATGVWGEDAPASDSCHCYLRWGCSCIWLLLEVTMHSALL